MRFAERMQGLEHSSIRNWTRMIAQQGGINLAQGICAIEPRPELVSSIEDAHKAMQAGDNTYSHFSGVDPLREAIAIKAKEYNRIVAEPGAMSGNILVTAGATGALVCAFNALVNPGEEVIFFEPFYRYNVNLLALTGGIAKFVPLQAPHWTFNPTDLDSALTEKTRVVLVNNPCNPCGKVFSYDELELIAKFCIKHDLIAISDEVYEYILFDGAKHISLASLPGMESRTITVASFSKTLAMTGWRLGYAIAPVEIRAKMGLVNDFNYACAPTPLQLGIAKVMRTPEVFDSLHKFYAPKRDALAEALEKAGFEIHVPTGAYYILADYRPLGFDDDFQAVTELVMRVGVGAVPGSEFFSDGRGSEYLRFCFAFTDKGISEAVKRLSKL